MIISISGSPGTGKSRIAELLAKELNANLISIKELVDNKKVPYRYDKKRRTKIIDPRNLQKAVKKNLVKGTNVVEGHLSHLIRSDLVIILRCNPRELKKRLARRRWSRSKIKENIQAEILDEITIEALQKHKRNKVFEIDTSKISARTVVTIIMKILNKCSSYKRYLTGKVDWSERYKKELIKK